MVSAVTRGRFLRYNRRTVPLYTQPITGKPYTDRSWDFPYKIDHEDLCFKLFTEAGFEWGGDWTTHKDYQHFEIIEQ